MVAAPFYVQSFSETRTRNRNDEDQMRLYVEPMEAVLVEFDDQRRVRFDREDWSVPTLQERRAILYAAQNEIAELTELIQLLESQEIGDRR